MVPHTVSLPLTAQLIASTLIADDALSRLLSILGTLLERNLSEDRIREFKGWLVHRLDRTGAILEQYLPFLKSHGVAFLLHLQAIIAGLWQLARPAPVVVRVLASPGYEAFRLDLEVELRSILAMLLRGCAAGSPSPYLSEHRQRTGARQSGSGRSRYGSGRRLRKELEE